LFFQVVELFLFGLELVLVGLDVLLSVLAFIRFVLNEGLVSGDVVSELLDLSLDSKIILVILFVV
jgi:hypothetical protein